MQNLFFLLLFVYKNPFTLLFNYVWYLNYSFNFFKIIGIHNCSYHFLADASQLNKN